MSGVSRERWARLDALLQAALEASSEQRDAVLREAAAEDPALEVELRDLLALQGEAEKVIAESVSQLVPLLLPGVEGKLEEELAEGLAPGSMVGPYRVVGEIGRGGMGAVYLAERADRQFEKQVAVKLVKRGMDSEEVLRRFRHERQILASLEHPNIARLLDGGVSSDGRPYLVMERVAGEPVDAYCDRRRLTVAERLRLFERVCEAVAYAHRNLVVHRDLKPSNILVGRDGVPKLLDFGIAKLLGGGGEEAPTTRTGGRVLTPQFASPEQIRGGRITTASDVFGLGIVLYLLLTGRLPFCESAAGEFEAERAVLEAEPDRPSLAAMKVPTGGNAATAEARARARSATPERLRRILRGDLDTLVLKALEKDPALRYESVEALLEDLHRHRLGRPLAARPGSAASRARKFVRRHRAAVGGFAAFVVLTMGWAGTFTLEHRRTVLERNRAELERDKAQEVAGFLEQLFAASNPLSTRGERLDTLPVREFLERGVLQVQRELVDRPLVQAQMLDAVGGVYHSLGRLEEAQPLLERALAQRRERLGARHPDVAESLTSLGLLLVQTGEYERAQVMLEEALTIRRMVPGERAADVADALNNLAGVLRERGRYDEAEARQREGLRLLEGADGDVRARIAAVTGSLASTLEYQGDYAAATTVLQRSLDLRRELYGNDHPLLAAGLQELGLLLQRQGDYEGAEAPAREALAISERTLGPEHPLVADGLNRLASVLWWQGDYHEAEPLQRRSLALKRKLYGDRHVQVSIGLGNLASLLSDMGGHDEAVALNREALAIVLETLGAEHPDAAIVTGSLATSLQARGDCAGAEPLFREALEGMRRMLPPDHVRIPMLQRRLGGCLTTLERFGEAEEILLVSYRALSESRGEHDPFTREVAGYLVALYEAWGRPAEAERYGGVGPG